MMNQTIWCLFIGVKLRCVCQCVRTIKALLAHLNLDRILAEARIYIRKEKFENHKIPFSNIYMSYVILLFKYVCSECVNMYIGVFMRV